MNNNKKSKLKEIKSFITLVIVVFVIKTCLIEVYVVPTGSMEKSILIGDMLIGNKFIYGMKGPNWIGIPWTRLGYYINSEYPFFHKNYKDSFRLPLFKNIESGDVVIFEYPRDPFQKYVKRCIGIPKDKISIANGIIIRNNIALRFPYDGQFIPKVETSFSYQNLNLNDWFKQFDSLSNIPLSDIGESLNLIEKNAYIYPKRYSGNKINLVNNLVIDTRNIYSLFEPELFDDFSDDNQYDEIEYYEDINNNKVWDYGNIDNIQEFVVPYKGQVINFNEVDNWPHIIYLLIQDGCNLEIGNYNININSSNDIAGLSGMAKYFILEKINFFIGTMDIPKKKQKEISEYFLDLELKKMNESIINPWELNQKKLGDKLYLELPEKLLLRSDGNGAIESIFPPVKIVESSLSDLCHFGNIIGFNFSKKECNENKYNGYDGTWNDATDHSIIFDPFQDLYINGKKISYDDSYTLKHDYYFLMGDNRNNSSDCRIWGFVPDYHILGSPVVSVVNVNKLIARFKLIK